MDPDINRKEYRRRILSWAFYDWANSAYITTTATTFFPPYFLALAAPSFLPAAVGPGREAAESVARSSASNVFAFTVAFALFVAAVLAPVVGTYADLTDQRKRILLGLTLVGGILASAMVVPAEGLWIAPLALYFLTQIIMNIALGLYSSLLPHVARNDDMNRASSLGYALGYAGGGLLLTVNTAVFFLADRIGITGDFAVRLAFLSAGLWWIVFTIPCALAVPEPKVLTKGRVRTSAVVRESLRQIADTLRAIRRYRELFRMLIAFWFYMEGVGAIILLATAYGAALGLDMGVLTATLLMTQFVAFPYSIVFGRIPESTEPRRAAYLAMLVWTAVTLPLAGVYARSIGPLDIRGTLLLLIADQAAGVVFASVFGRILFSRLVDGIDTKRAVVVGLLIYLIVPVWGFFLTSRAEFIMLGWLVGTVQGGTQALSRTIYSRLSPPARSGEFFGLYGLSEKFAGILGPVLYAAVGEITHNPKSSILSIFVFFLTGIILLIRVDVEAGARVAAEEERAAESSL